MSDVSALGRTKAEKERKAALIAIYGGLFDAVGRTGGVLTGFSIKLDIYETLCTLRAEFPAGARISFVGAEDLPAVLAKSMRDAGADRLKWRNDRFVGKAEGDEQE